MWRRIAFVLIVAAGAFVAGFRFRPPRPEDQRAGKFPEQVVYVRASDDVVNAGLLFSGKKDVAVIWVHGWGANFYLPSYVGIGRALAELGYTTISVNTRMHDLGNVAKHTPTGKRVRGGGYWGVTSEDARDIAAWVGYAEGLGFARVVLVGHSAGWASVGRYQADSGDARVVGLVFASGQVGYTEGKDDPEWVARAKKLVEEGAGEEMMKIPNRNYPSFISAATDQDIRETAREYKDFFGTATANPAVMRVSCPLLAFFGTRGDVGGEKELELLKTAVARLSEGPRVQTAMIAGGDHVYLGEEAQVARTIGAWIDEVRRPGGPRH